MIKELPDDVESTDPANDMMCTVIQFSLSQYKVKEDVKAKDILKSIDKEELEEYKKHFQLNLMRSFNNKKSLDRFKQNLGIDLGHYPLTPWQDQKYKEEINIGGISQRFYLAPRPRNDLIVVPKHECQYRYVVKEKINQNELFQNSGLDFEELRTTIEKFNIKLDPLRKKLS